MPSPSNTALKPSRDAAAPEPAAAGPAAEPTLESIRAGIDHIDDTILDLLEERMRLAARIGTLKPSGQVDALKLRPDREARVIARLMARAHPSNRRLAMGVWREIMAAGLARQGELEVLVWGGRDPALVLDSARRRFGSSASYRVVEQPAEALTAAAGENAVAVLAVDPSTPWWTRLAAQYRDLWVFDAIDNPRRVGDPGALAVARIDPEALAGGRTFVISAGGDAGQGEPARRLIGMDEGWRLYVVDRAEEQITTMDRYRGVLGRAPSFSLDAEEAAHALDGESAAT